MPLDDLAKWLRWSNTRQAWLERLGVAGVAAAALSLWFFAADAPAWLQVIGWGSLALLLAYFSRRGWLKLFGPVLFYDLIRNARRTRFFAYRITYLGILLFLLCWMFLTWRPHHYSLTDPIRSGEAAELALRYFVTFIIVQMLFVVVLTPAFTASAIAEEKERKTMEFILATDLRNREIVFGKLLSRMAMLSMFLLAGLPVLSALQFLGGFSPRVMLVCYAGTLLTMVSLASLTLLGSVLARRTRDALVLVYLVLLGYLGITVIAHYQLNAGSYNSFPSRPGWDSPVTLEDVLFAVRAGNPIFAVGSVISPRGIDEDGLVRALRSYAIFHGVLTLVCVGASVGLVRRMSLRTPAARATGTTPLLRWRPQLSRWPMVWKEVWAERGKRRWALAIGMLFLMALSFLPVAFMLADYYRILSQGQYQVLGYYWDPWERLGSEVNGWVRSVGVLVFLLGMAGVGVRAAASVRGEHDRDTMTPLLLSPLSSEEILFGKWLGAITSMRWFVPWLGLIWLTAVGLNGMTPGAVPVLAISCLCYAAAAASVGLWCSVVCRTSMRAILSTLFIGLLLLGGHWLPWMCCIPVAPHLPDDMQFVIQMQGAVTPPVVVAGYLPHSPKEMEYYRQEPLWNPIWLMFVGVSGAGVWGLFGWFVWLRANRRFKKDGGRMDVVRRPLYVPTGADRQRHEAVPARDGAREHADKVRLHQTNGHIAEDTDFPG